jgi:hypothetical protein
MRDKDETGRLTRRRRKKNSGNPERANHARVAGRAGIVRNESSGMEADQFSRPV